MRSRSALAVLGVLLTLPLLMAACGGDDDEASGSAGGSSSQSSGEGAAVVSVAESEELGQRILVDREGMTLYHLSEERNGRFTCTDATCLSLWTPLEVTAGTEAPETVRSLDLIERPDGGTQLTYRGLPLYTFNDDSRPGDVEGEGFRDVGVWHAATVTGASAGAGSSEPAPIPASPRY
jgi:predicted lipoprotein with Yx(FWY)xxD motif